MPSPFPGMDPYLENPELWSEVHSRLIVAIADAIAPSLRPKYRVAIEKRTYLSGDDSVLVGIPDVAVLSQRSTSIPTLATTTLSSIRQPLEVTVPMPEMVSERYLEIREIKTDYTITVIEVLSPTNKRVGEGRQIYHRKRLQVLASARHLIEIDLLRAGQPPLVFQDIHSAYRILVSRSNRRPVSDLYAFTLREPIPAFPIPLKAEDVEPLLDLQETLNGVYDRAGYDLAIDYSQPSIPPLSEADTVWAANLLRSDRA
ncbi:MAG: DUF4058 family protein [Oculatellaceae cyanobacterium bins.114]|nr:DUF4058 family protein [Oculatellaceae cyanobacterium bins.114]